MAVAFAGTDELAARVLEGLLASFPVAHVITQPDRPAGRGLKLRPTPVKERAVARGIPVATPERLDERGCAEIASLPRAELLTVCSYGLYIPEELIALYPRRAVNFHPSLVPAYRGASPIVSALLDGVTVTGVSIIDVAPEMDAGDVYAQVAVPVTLDDTRVTLTDRLLEAGIPLFVRVIDEILRGTARAVPQRGTPTYCRKLAKEDLVIPWTDSAIRIHNLVRALSPKPAARTLFRGGTTKILRTDVLADFVGPEAAPGEIVVAREKLVVATGDGLLAILEIQPAGSRPMDARAFVNGYRPVPGERFGSREDDRVPS